MKPYKCKILVYDILSYDDFYSKNDVYPVGLEYLLKQSDVITLHLPLDNTTRNILNEQRLKLIKDGSVLINLARGGLIEENVLKELLLQNKIGGAALDVFAIEPPTDNEIIHLDNVLVTPHIGGSTEQAILAMGMSAIDALENAKDPLSFI